MEEAPEVYNPPISNSSLYQSAVSPRGYQRSKTPTGARLNASYNGEHRALTPKNMKGLNVSQKSQVKGKDVSKTRLFFGEFVKQNSMLGSTNGTRLVYNREYQ